MKQLLLFASLFLWATHVSTCVFTGQWFVGIMGAVVFPFGILHGLAITLGIV